jgi:hypothetical protein
MNKLQQLNNDGFYKVATHQHLSFSTVTFFNPLTKETKNIWTSDTDNPQYYEEEEYELYVADEDKAVREQWLDYNGVIRVGCKVKIVKGRKFVGEIKRVVKEYTYKINGMYGRPYGDIPYLVFEDGTKVAWANCKLYVEEVE